VDELRLFHMPLLRNADKSKISKRKNPVSINYYRQAGFLPEALLNYLAMMGWTMPDATEKFTVADMIENFTLERMSLGGPVFDVQKLTWLNGLYIREQGTDSLVQMLRETMFSEERLKELVPLVYERIDKVDDFIDHTAFFFNGDVPYDEEATKNLIPKKRERKEIIKALEAVVEKIDGVGTLTVENTEAMLRGLCEEIAWKPKELFMPVRVAVTGRKATPPLFETIVALGKERSRRRLRNAIKHLKTLKD
ncbi:MAG: glutamate--tRNA ligase family protein, partial [Myxococcota bacterium]